MPANDTRIRENFNRQKSRHDYNMAPGDMGYVLPKEVRSNYVGGEKAYHKDVKKYAKQRGWDYGSGHDMSHHGEGKPHGG